MLFSDITSFATAGLHKAWATRKIIWTNPSSLTWLPNPPPLRRSSLGSRNFGLLRSPPSRLPPLLHLLSCKKHLHATASALEASTPHPQYSSVTGHRFTRGGRYRKRWWAIWLTEPQIDCQLLVLMDSSAVLAKLLLYRPVHQVPTHKPRNQRDKSHAQIRAFWVIRWVYTA